MFQNGSIGKFDGGAKKVGELKGGTKRGEAGDGTGRFGAGTPSIGLLVGCMCSLMSIHKVYC
jgi:hypothetical protein